MLSGIGLRGTDSVILVVGRQNQAASWGLLTNQFSQIGELQGLSLMLSQKNKVERRASGRWLTLTSGLYAHAHQHLHTPMHTLMHSHTNDEGRD